MRTKKENEAPQCAGLMRWSKIVFNFMEETFICMSGGYDPNNECSSNQSFLALFKYDQGDNYKLIYIDLPKMKLPW